MTEDVPINRVSNFCCSILFMLVTLAFPFLISIQYHEPIQTKTMNIAIGIYVMTIATTSKNMFIFFFLLIYAMYLFSSYGAYKPTDYFDFWREIWTYKGGIVITATLVGIWEKYVLHILEGAPFVPLKTNYNRNRGRM